MYDNDSFDLDRDESTRRRQRLKRKAEKRQRPTPAEDKEVRSTSKEQQRLQKIEAKRQMAQLKQIADDLTLKELLSETVQDKALHGYLPDSISNRDDRCVAVVLPYERVSDEVLRLMGVWLMFRGSQVQITVASKRVPVDDYMEWSRPHNLTVYQQVMYSANRANGLRQEVAGALQSLLTGGNPRGKDSTRRS